MIGTAFGIVCARIFTAPLFDIIKERFLDSGSVSESFYLWDRCRFVRVYGRLCGVPYGDILSSLSIQETDSTILDNIGGSLFTLFEYMLLVSMAYNLILGFDSGSVLLEVDEIRRRQYCGGG